MKKHQKASKPIVRRHRIVVVEDERGVKTVRKPATTTMSSTILEIETRRERIRTVEEYEKQRDALIALIYR